jgi:L-aminopeptidase/D-esterase-like protein
MSENDTITAIRGVRVGHAQDERLRTGCTCVVFDRAYLTAVDARGGAPGTIETDRLAPSKTFPTTDALLFAGGSAYGLDAVAGARQWLLEQGRGWRFFGRPIPLVSGAIVLDLGARSGAPDASMARRAAEAAGDEPVGQGGVGAGCGCTVGKLRGLRAAMMGGVGSYAVELRGGIRVGALVVVNAVGNIVDPRTGRTIAGTRRDDGPGFVSPEEISGAPLPSEARGTTVGLVATNVRLPHGALLKVAEMAHDGLARTIIPSHMTTDGDALFAVATGERTVAFEEGDFPYSKVDWVGHAAARCVEESVLRAVRYARSVPWDDAIGGVLPGLAG